MLATLKSRKFRVAIIGATGLVGREMISIMEKRNFPIQSLFLYASEESSGKKETFHHTSLTVKPFTEKTLSDFDTIDIALLSAGNAFSREFAPKIAEHGTICIDNSNAWRMDPEIPLVVPEVNYQDIGYFKAKGIIANPNCSTIQMVQILHPIHTHYRIKRIVVSTYQSVSGKGKDAMEELTDQLISILSKKEIHIHEFPHQIASNCLPHIDEFLENDYTKEEMKMIQETKKILHAPDVQITATCVRIPVYSCHAESVNIETQTHASAHDIRILLSSQKGIKVVDNPKQNLYPLNNEAAGQDETYVGRIRQDESIPNGINLWIVSDNLRKGAALNAVQIAEALIDEFL